MLKGALNGRPFCQIFQGCFCQSYTTYSRPTVTVLGQSRLLFNGELFINSKTSDCYNKISRLNSSNLCLIQKHYEKTLSSIMSTRSISSSDEQSSPLSENKELSKKDRLKRTVKDYGATVIVFHIALSLTSLGISYLSISSGLDVASLLTKVGLSGSSDLATGASTFVVAYAVHKVFAPVRISITLGATPFIVRYLRRVGVLKPPKTSGP